MKQYPLSLKIITAVTLVSFLFTSTVAYADTHTISSSLLKSNHLNPLPAVSGIRTLFGLAHSAVSGTLRVKPDVSNLPVQSKSELRVSASSDGKVRNNKLRTDKLRKRVSWDEIKKPSNGKSNNGDRLTVFIKASTKELRSESGIRIKYEPIKRSSGPNSQWHRISISIGKNVNPKDVLLAILNSNEIPDGILFHYRELAKSKGISVPETRSELRGLSIGKLNPQVQPVRLENFAGKNIGYSIRAEVERAVQAHAGVLLLEGRTNQASLAALWLKIGFAELVSREELAHAIADTVRYYGRSIVVDRTADPLMITIQLREAVKLWGQTVTSVTVFARPDFEFRALPEMWRTAKRYFNSNFNEWINAKQPDIVAQKHEHIKEYEVILDGRHADSLYTEILNGNFHTTAASYGIPDDSSKNAVLKYLYDGSPQPRHFNAIVSAEDLLRERREAEGRQRAAELALIAQERSEQIAQEEAEKKERPEQVRKMLENFADTTASFNSFGLWTVTITQAQNGNGSYLVHLQAYEGPGFTFRIKNIHTATDGSITGQAEEELQRIINSKKAARQKKIRTNLIRFSLASIVIAAMAVGLIWLTKEGKQKGYRLSNATATFYPPITNQIPSIESREEDSKSKLLRQRLNLDLISKFEKLTYKEDRETLLTFLNLLPNARVANKITIGEQEMEYPLEVLHLTFRVGDPLEKRLLVVVDYDRFNALPFEIQIALINWKLNLARFLVDPAYTEELFVKDGFSPAAALQAARKIPWNQINLDDPKSRAAAQEYVLLESEPYVESMLRMLVFLNEFKGIMNNKDSYIMALPQFQQAETQRFFNSLQVFLSPYINYARVRRWALQRTLTSGKPHIFNLALDISGVNQNEKDKLDENFEWGAQLDRALHWYLYPTDSRFNSVHLPGNNTFQFTGNRRPELRTGQSELKKPTNRTLTLIHLPPYALLSGVIGISLLAILPAAILVPFVMTTGALLTFFLLLPRESMEQTYGILAAYQKIRSELRAPSLELTLLPNTQEVRQAQLSDKHLKNLRTYMRAFVGAALASSRIQLEFNQELETEPEQISGLPGYYKINLRVSAVSQVQAMIAVQIFYLRSPDQASAASPLMKGFVSYRYSELRTAPESGDFLLNGKGNIKLGATHAEFPEDIESGSIGSAILDEDASAMRDLMERFLRSEVGPVAQQIDEGKVQVRDVLKIAGKAGYLGLTIPEEYGGSKVRTVIKSIWDMLSWFYSPSFGLAAGVHMGVSSGPINVFGTEEQKQRFLPLLASGEWIGDYGLTEPNHGSDALSSDVPLDTKAELVDTPDGKKWKITGTKRFITNSGFANLSIIFAQTGQKIDSTTGRMKYKKSVFIVEHQTPDGKPTPGLEILPPEKKMGLHGSYTSDIILKDVLVSQENLLGKLGDGQKIGMATMSHGRLSIAASAWGGTKRIFEDVIDYVRLRTQFGANKPIKVWGAVQKSIANFRALLYAQESLVFAVSALIDGGVSNPTIEASVAKYWISNTFHKMSFRAAQLFGGAGYILDTRVARVALDGFVTTIFEGMNDVLDSHVIASETLKYLNKQVWPKNHQLLDEWKLPPDSPLVELEPLVRQAASLIEETGRRLNKKYGAATEAMKKRPEIQDEFMDFGKMVSELYVMLVTINRTQKRIDLELKSSHQIDLTRLVLLRGTNEIRHYAARFLSPEDLGLPQDFRNLKSLQRLIADHVLNFGDQVFEKGKVISAGFGASMAVVSKTEIEAMDGELKHLLFDSDHFPAPSNSSETPNSDWLALRYASRLAAKRAVIHQLLLEGGEIHRTVRTAVGEGWRTLADLIDPSILSEIHISTDDPRKPAVILDKAFRERFKIPDTINFQVGFTHKEDEAGAIVRIERNKENTSSLSGIGIDEVLVSQFENEAAGSAQDFNDVRFNGREKEQAFLSENPARTLAIMWAVKRAFFKALPLNAQIKALSRLSSQLEDGTTGWSDIEVVLSELKETDSTAASPKVLIGGEPAYQVGVSINPNQIDIIRLIPHLDIHADLLSISNQNRVWASVVVYYDSDRSELRTANELPPMNVKHVWHLLTNDWQSINQKIKALERAVQNRRKYLNPPQERWVAQEETVKKLSSINDRMINFLSYLDDVALENIPDLHLAKQHTDQIVQDLLESQEMISGFLKEFDGVHELQSWSAPDLISHKHKIGRLIFLYKAGRIFSKLTVKKGGSFNFTLKYESRQMRRSRNRAASVDTSNSGQQPVSAIKTGRGPDLKTSALISPASTSLSVSSPSARRVEPPTGAFKDILNRFDRNAKEMEDFRSLTPGEQIIFKLSNLSGNGTPRLIRALIRENDDLFFILEGIEGLKLTYLNQFGGATKASTSANFKERVFLKKNQQLVIQDSQTNQQINIIYKSSKGAQRHVTVEMNRAIPVIHWSRLVPEERNQVDQYFVSRSELRRTSGTQKEAVTLSDLVIHRELLRRDVPNQESDITSAIQAFARDNKAQLLKLKKGELTQGRVLEQPIIFEGQGEETDPVTFERSVVINFKILATTRPEAEGLARLSQGAEADIQLFNDLSSDITPESREAIRTAIQEAYKASNHSDNVQSKRSTTEAMVFTENIFFGHKGNLALIGEKLSAVYGRYFVIVTNNAQLEVIHAINQTIKDPRQHIVPVESYPEAIRVIEDHYRLKAHFVGTEQDSLILGKLNGSVWTQSVIAGLLSGLEPILINHFQAAMRLAYSA